MHSSENIPSSEIDQFIAACETYGALHLPVSSVTKKANAPEQVIMMIADGPSVLDKEAEMLEGALATVQSISTHYMGHIQTIGDLFESADSTQEHTPEMTTILESLEQDEPDSFSVRSYEVFYNNSSDQILLTIARTTGRAALGATTEHSIKKISVEGVETELSVFTYPTGKGTQNRNLQYRVRPAHNPVIDGVIQFFVERDDPESVSVVSEVFVNELAGDAKSLATNQRLLGELDEESRNQLYKVVEQVQKHKAAHSFAAQFGSMYDSGATSLRSLTAVLIGQSISLLN